MYFKFLNEKYIENIFFEKNLLSKFSFLTVSIHIFIISLKILKAEYCTLVLSQFNILIPTKVFRLITNMWIQTSQSKCYIKWIHGIYNCLNVSWKSELFWTPVFLNVTKCVRMCCCVMVKYIEVFYHPNTQNYGISYLQIILTYFAVGIIFILLVYWIKSADHVLSLDNQYSIN